MARTMPETLDYLASAPPPGAPPVATDTVEPYSEAPLWAAALPLLSLLGVCALAFSSATKPALTDKVTLAALALMTALFAYAPFLRRVREDRDAASFALCAAFFVIYGLARRVVPDNAFAVGGEVKLGLAAYAVILGALVGAPAWLKSFGGWTRATLFALSLLALLGWLSYRFLGMFYLVGPTQMVNPTALRFLLTQIVEFGALALCCAAVAANTKTRRLALLILPALLLILVMRYKTMPAPEDDE